MGTLETIYRAGWQALADNRLEDLLDIYAPDVEVRETVARSEAATKFACNISPGWTRSLTSRST